MSKRPHRLLSGLWRAGLVLALAVSSLPVRAEKLPTARPESVGLSSARLERLDRVMGEYVEKGRLVGAVTLVARKGKVARLGAYGTLDPAAGTAMPADAVFRIASQTKAVTSVAVMILFEEGKLLLGDPVAKYIPEFKETTVAVAETGRRARGYRLVPAGRPITIRDLLTHTAGISYGDGPAKDAYEQAGIHGWYFADKPEPIGSYVRKLAGLPFDAQPGTKWVYGFNTDILGHVVEVVSGMSLAEFVEKRICDPLKMEDTHFFLPEEKLGRFTPVYGAGKDGSLGLVESAADNAYVKGPRACFSGGAGLLSTAEDYARFLLMLLNGGEWGGARVLGPKSVELMTVDHVGDLYGDLGFGLGFWITERLGRRGELGSVGSFGWGGAYHTTYWVDPAERLVAVFMTQLLPAGDIDIQAKFRSLVYQSIIN
jgi:CubicO group peptidase (beta-lactamase class C family)